jgi:hypothetical protein
LGRCKGYCIGEYLIHRFKGIWDCCMEDEMIGSRCSQVI